MECTYCDVEQSVLMALPITFEAKTLRSELVGESGQSICISCLVYEMFQVMMDEKEKN